MTAPAYVAHVIGLDAHTTANPRHPALSAAVATLSRALDGQRVPIVLDGTDPYPITQAEVAITEAMSAVVDRPTVAVMERGSDWGRLFVYLAGQMLAVAVIEVSPAPATAVAA